MTISIITVTLNNQSTIEDTVTSVLGQTYPGTEYIVIDGKSSDGTVSILEKYKSRISRVISEKDNGIYDAMNKGIGLATGKIIGFLHGDDLYAHASVLEHVVDVFNKNRSDGVYSDLVYVHAENTGKIFRYWKAGPYREGLFLTGWMPPHPTFFVRKEIYDRYGNFNTSFKYSGDYELMLRFIHKFKIQVNYLPEVTVRMRVGGISNLSLMNRFSANKEDRKAWKINGLQPGNFTLIRKPLSKLKQFLSVGTTL